MRRQTRTALMVSVTLAVSVGCLVVAPLPDLPREPASSQAGSGAAGKNQTGSSALGGQAGEGGEAPLGGSAGSGGTSGCQTNAECMGPLADEPARCRPSDRKCVGLRHEACPIVRGAVSDPNAVYFGAFATLDGVAPEDNSIVWSHELALEELSGDAVGGLPDGPKGKRRPLVMIVCNNLDELVEPAMQHLAEEVQVPAVIATLKPGDLRRAYETYAERDIFYLSPVSVTRSLVTAPDRDRIWNILGQPSDFAATYVALLRRSEAWLRSSRGLGDEPLKVALVATTDAFDSELRNSVTGALRFNEEQTAAQNQTNGNFMAVTLDPAKPDLENQAVALAQFQPDIVISTAGELFLQSGGLQVFLEGEWAVRAPGKPRPFYILSPYDAGNLAGLRERMSGAIAAGAPQDNQRYVGVTIAPPRDTTLQRAYEVRLRSRFKDAILDTANYYDAVYYLAYAMYAAKEPQPTGAGVTAGMYRLLAGQEPYDIGPSAISDVFKALTTEGSLVRLNGTLGPPDFDTAKGIRPVEGAVFCFSRSGETARLVPHAARLDSAQNALAGDFKACNPSF